MKFRLSHDRTAERSRRAASSIPDIAEEKPQKGAVVAVGCGVGDEGGKLIPLEVKKGDSVLFDEWSGTEVKIDGGSF